MEEFKNLVINALTEKLGAGYRVVGNTITKVNDEVLHSICIVRDDEKISKSIYLENYYEKYPESSIDEIVEHIIAVYRMDDDVMEECLEFIDSIVNYEQLKDSIYMKLVNKEHNSSYLQDKCYMEYLDFAILFYVLITQKNGEELSITVTQMLKDLWKVSVDELYNQAYTNMAERSPAVIKKVSQVIGEIMETGDMDIDLAVLSNERMVNGSALMLFTDVLKAFADENEVDEVIIIPSTVHELLLYPKKAGNEVTEERCLEMLLEVNDTMVQQCDFLSNNIYVYSIDSSDIKIWNK